MKHKNEKIWLSSPHMGDQELRYVREAFESNWIAPLGPHVDAFEVTLAEYHGLRSAAVLTSGTAAIHLALVLAEVKPGDTVLCQSFTFVGSANPVRYVGATPVFIDSETDTWNMDPVLLERAIREGIEAGKKPAAVIAVNLYGMPAKLREIRAVCDAYEVMLIEDAAESLGASVFGRKTGTFGKVGVLSFNGNKIITTSGGGAAVSDDVEMMQKMRFLATQAREAAPHYQHEVTGYNYRMSNVLAAIGRGQMEVLEERVAQRRAVHDRYFRALGESWLDLDQVELGSVAKSAGAVKKHGSAAKDLFVSRTSSPTGIYFLREPEGYVSNRWLTTILINPKETGGITREDVRLALADMNIEARPLWKPMHLQPLFREAPAYIHGVSEWLFEIGLCLPSGSNLDIEAQDRVIEQILLALR